MCLLDVRETVQSVRAVTTIAGLPYASRVTSVVVVTSIVVVSGCDDTLKLFLSCEFVHAVLVFYTSCNPTQSVTL